MWSDSVKLHYARFNGSQWSGVYPFENSSILFQYNKWYLSDEELIGAPSLLVANDELHVIYSFGFKKQTRAIYSSVYYRDSNTWSNPNFIDLIRYPSESYSEHHLTKNISSCFSVEGKIYTPFTHGNHFFHSTYQVHQKKLYHVPLNYHAEKIGPLLDKAKKIHHFDAVFALKDELINNHLADMFKSIWAGGNPVENSPLPWKLNTIADVSPVTPSIKESYILKAERRKFFCPRIEIINSTSSTNPKSEVLLQIDLFGGKFYPEGINSRSTAIDIKHWKFKIKSHLRIKKLDQDLSDESYPEFRNKLNNMRKSYGDIDILFLDLQSAELFGEVDFSGSNINPEDRKKFNQAIKDYVKSIRSHRHGHPHGWIFSGVAANREVHRTLPDKGELYFTDSALAVHSGASGKAVYWLLMSNNNTMPNIVNTNVAEQYLIHPMQGGNANGTFHLAPSAVLGAVVKHLHGSYGNIPILDFRDKQFVISRIVRKELCLGANVKKDIRFSYREGKVFGEITDTVNPDLPSRAKDHYVLFPSTAVTVKSQFEYDIDLKENRISFKGKLIHSDITFVVAGVTHTEVEFNQRHPVLPSIRQQDRNRCISDFKTKIISDNKMLLGNVSHSFLQVAQPAHTQYDFSPAEMSELFGFKINLNSKQ